LSPRSLAPRSSARISWFIRIGDVLDLVTGAGHKPKYAFGPQGRNDAGGPTAPIKSSQDSLTYLERIEQLVMQKLAENGGKVPDELKY
jgi:hypothetical protein